MNNDDKLSSTLLSEIRKEIKSELQSTRQKRRRVPANITSIILGVLFFSFGIFATLFAQQDVMPGFYDQEILTAGKLNRSLRGVVPIGAVVAWHRDVRGPGNPLTLPVNFVECNGQEVNDGDSPIDGTDVPNLNGYSSGKALAGMNATDAVFLRGGTVSGVPQLDYFQDHSHSHGLSYSWPNIVVKDAVGSGSAGSFFVPHYMYNIVVSNHAAGYHKENYGAELDGGSITITNDPANSGRAGSETTVKNMSVIWIMRIK